MSRSKKSRTISADGGPSDWRSRIHHISFSPSDEREAKEWWELQSQDWWTLFEELVDSQWAIKVSPPSNTDNYWCSLSRKGADSEWSGHTFVIQYPGLRGAIVLSSYFASTWLKEGRITTESRHFLGDDVK